MLEWEVIQGRKIGSAEIAEIGALIAANPRWSRRRLSEVLAQRWQWYAASGVLKDMAARSLLLKLHQRGDVILPERRRAPSTRGPKAGPDLFESLPQEPIVADLSSLRPLQVHVVGPRLPHYQQFQRYLVQHHYLGYRGPVGENFGYLIQSRTGVDLACLLFGAAAWQCAPRDRWIGWSAEQRAEGLAFIANNSRFLILPWVRVPQLANHLLSQIAQRIDADWQRRYHYDDIEDHKVVASKEEWDFFQRLLLILKSDAEIVEETGKRIWTARQAVALVCLVVFVVVVARTGWGSHLFLATVPLGGVSILLKLWHSSLEEAQLRQQAPLLPFGSVSEMRSLRRKVRGFVKSRYPTQLGSRTIRGPVSEAFNWLHFIVVWLLFSPVESRKPVSGLGLLSIRLGDILLVVPYPKAVEHRWRAALRRHAKL